MLMKIIALFLISFSVLALDNNFELRNLTSENTLSLHQSMSNGYAKEIHIQDGKQVKKLDPSKPYCTLSNARSKKEAMIVNAGMTFTFDNNDYLRERTYIAIIIWHNHWFWGRDNAVVQDIACSTRPINGLDSPNLDIGQFKKIVGKILSIK